MQNDREVRAREGHRHHLQYNKNYRDPPKQSLVVDEQPKRKAQMVAPGIFKIRRDNAVPMYQLGQEHRQSEKGRVRAMAGGKVQNVLTQKSAMTNHRLERGQRGTKAVRQNQNDWVNVSAPAGKEGRPGQEAMPTVVVTGPEGYTQSAHGMSAEHPPCPVDGPISLNRGVNDPSIGQLPRGHSVAEYSTLGTTNHVDEVDISVRQETSAPVSSTASEEVQKPRLDSHALSDCSPTIEPTAAVVVQLHALAECSNSVELTATQTEVMQQHALAECTKSPSTPSVAQEPSYVHDFADCPGTVLEYYKKGAKKTQTHHFSHCAGQSSASDMTSPGKKRI
jgi:hypothetical protein